MSDNDPQHWTATYAKSPMRSTPYRRLNVVPKRVCAECIHHDEKFAANDWICKAGDTKTSTVTGKSWYVTRCRTKNRRGDCDDFEQIDHEAIEEKRKRKAIVNARWALAGLLLMFAVFAVIFIERYGGLRLAPQLHVIAVEAGES